MRARADSSKVLELQLGRRARITYCCVGTGCEGREGEVGRQRETELEAAPPRPPSIKARPGQGRQGEAYCSMHAGHGSIGSSQQPAAASSTEVRSVEQQHRARCRAEQSRAASRRRSGNRNGWLWMGGWTGGGRSKRSGSLWLWHFLWFWRIRRWIDRQACKQAVVVRLVVSEVGLCLCLCLLLWHQYQHYAILSAIISAIDRLPAPAPDQD